MEKQRVNELLLKTAFSCMACDGEIDNKEVQVIKDMHAEKKIFGEINLENELDKLVGGINKDGYGFLKLFFSELTTANLSEKDELRIIETAIETIKADNKVEYSEVKFFKVIRSKLKISNEAILEIHPEFEDYLEEDIMSESYLARIQDDFLSSNTLPEFELIKTIVQNDSSIIDTETDE
jgi:uncharacterized tellurite resistance protein B-like protein